MSADDNDRDDETNRPPDAGWLARRAVLRAAGATAALSLGTGATAVATNDGPSGGSSTPSPDGPNGNGAPDTPGIDPIFGRASAGPSPCFGDDADHGELDTTPDCLDEFGAGIRPDHEVELHIDVPEPLLLFGQFGSDPALPVAEINDAVAGGTVDDDRLTDSDLEVTITPSGGDGLTHTVREFAELLADTEGFHYSPAGLHVRPGDVVVWDAETPDHGVAAYHERHGRQNRVPDGVGPITAPMIPVQGYWLYKFDTPGVYDFYCPPHQLFGMVMRVVVHDEGDDGEDDESEDGDDETDDADGDDDEKGDDETDDADGDDDGSIPTLDVESIGRPPVAENALPLILGGLDPNVPSSAEALDAAALAPKNIVENGPIGWGEVVAEHRS